MKTEADVRAIAILASSLAARAIARLCEAGAAAWATSRTRQCLPLPGEAFRFWSTLVATAALTAVIARVVGAGL